MVRARSQGRKGGVDERESVSNAMQYAVQDTGEIVSVWNGIWAGGGLTEQID